MTNTQSVLENSVEESSYQSIIDVGVLCTQLTQQEIKEELSGLKTIREQLEHRLKCIKPEEMS